mmetsp:Transcript_52299/g.136175  ORF Transcript_52299/g.136175 Transcript_52299/m.136175 type:complete len:237 (+) Transcript_52299:1657-2367(+)
MELAVSFNAFCLISSICSRRGSRSDLIADLTVLRLSTSVRSTLGRTPSSSVPSGARVLPSSSTSLWHLETSISFGLSTVVKQMLCSWMMDGYRLLKSRSITKSSYRPTFGSSTRPPVYSALPRRGAAPPAACSGSSGSSMPPAPAAPPPSICRRRFRVSMLSLSGRTNFFLWNSWHSSISLRSARLFCNDMFQRFPARFVSCLLSGSSCSECTSRATQRAQWKVLSASWQRASADS